MIGFQNLKNENKKVEFFDKLKLSYDLYKYFLYVCFVLGILKTDKIGEMNMIEPGPWSRAARWTVSS